MSHEQIKEGRGVRERRVKGRISKEREWEMMTHSLFELITRQHSMIDDVRRQSIATVLIQQHSTMTEAAGITAWQLTDLECRVELYHLP